MKNKKVLILSIVAVIVLVLLAIVGAIIVLSGQSSKDIDYMSYCKDDIEAINVCDGYAEILSMNPGSITFIFDDGKELVCPVMPPSELSNECKDYMSKGAGECELISCREP